jgi:hypothetical protein
LSVSSTGSCVALPPPAAFVIPNASVAINLTQRERLMIDVSRRTHGFWDPLRQKRRTIRCSSAVCMLARAISFQAPCKRSTHNSELRGCRCACVCVCAGGEDGRGLCGIHVESKMRLRRAVICSEALWVHPRGTPAKTSLHTDLMCNQKIRFYLADRGPMKKTFLKSAFGVH